MIITATTGSAITGLILAGGRGTRMGSVDKGLQLFRGIPMVQHVAQRLQPQVAQLMINANRNLAQYEAICSPVWPDVMADFAGPLAGLQTGLMHCQTPYLVTAPCDSPFVPTDLVARLMAALASQNTELAVATTGTAERPQSHPVFCLVRTSLLPHLTNYLRNGGRKFDAWYATLSAAQVHFDDESAFRNINTLDELNRFASD